VKRRALFALILITVALPISARAYLGVSQGLVSTSVEAGYMTRSFEENLSLSLPLVYGNFSLPMGSANILYRIQRLNPLVLGVGPAARIAWHADGGYILAGGAALSLSWEALRGSEVLFAEFSYLPFSTEQGAALDPLAAREIGQWVRIGWRHLF